MAGTVTTLYFFKSPRGLFETLGLLDTLR